MTSEEWNDIKHVVINKIMCIAYSTRRLSKLIQTFEKDYANKSYYLGEIEKRIFEIENWFKIMENKDEEE